MSLPSETGSRVLSHPRSSSASVTFRATGRLSLQDLHLHPNVQNSNRQRDLANSRPCPASTTVSSPRLNEHTQVGCSERYGKCKLEKDSHPAPYACDSRRNPTPLPHRTVLLRGKARQPEAAFTPPPLKLLKSDGVSQEPREFPTLWPHSQC